ncbi:MAG: hypothetical protein AAB316_04370, partial [Bacteroidota bacterium]
MRFQNAANFFEKFARWRRSIGFEAKSEQKEPRLPLRRAGVFEVGIELDAETVRFVEVYFRGFVAW